MACLRIPSVNAEKGWGTIARPPCSWISATVVSRRWLRFRRACRKTPRRCPLRVVTSSATTTWIRLPRSRARRWHSTAASIRSWSAIAIRSRSVWFSAKSRISAAEAVPSEAIEWMCTSALPGRAPARIRRASSGAIRRPASPGFSSVGLLRPLQIGPDRVEDCQPLLRRVGYDALEQQRLFPSHRPAPLPPAQPPGRRNRPENATIAARAHPPHARNVRRRSGLGGQQGRPGRNLRLRAEELDLEPAAGQVAVGDDADRLVAAQDRQQLGARLFDRQDADADDASRPSSCRPGCARCGATPSGRRPGRGAGGRGTRAARSSRNGGRRESAPCVRQGLPRLRPASRSRAASPGSGSRSGAPGPARCSSGRDGGRPIGRSPPGRAGRWPRGGISRPPRRARPSTPPRGAGCAGLRPGGHGPPGTRCCRRRCRATTAGRPACAGSAPSR